MKFSFPFLFSLFIWGSACSEDVRPKRPIEQEDVAKDLKHDSGPDLATDTDMRDLSKSIDMAADSTDASIDIVEPECASDAQCNKNRVCTDNVCVCKDGELNNGSCKPVCETICGENERCINAEPENKCACKTGFEKMGNTCIVAQIVKKVTRLEATINDGDTSTQSAFSASNYDQVVPFLSGRSGSFIPTNAYFIPEITNSGIQFSRVGNEGTLSVAANLTEFDEKHIEVFKGSLTLSEGNQVAQIAMNGILPEKSFLVFYTSFDSAMIVNPFNAAPENTSLRGTVSNNKIEFSRSKSKGSLNIRWYLVVSKGDAFRVEHKAVNILKGRKHSTEEMGSPNPFLLWSNQTSRAFFREGHTRCQYLPVVMGGDPKIRCSRGKTDLNPSPNAIEIALQVIHFQNPKLTIKHLESSMDGGVRRNIILNNFNEKDSALLGQLGSAGSVMLAQGTADQSSAHPAMCSVRITTFGGNDIIEVKRESTQQKAQVSIQYLNWY